MNLEELKSLRIAFVHDWLTGMRGGENVLEQMIEVLGPRDLYTLVSIEDKLSETIRSCNIIPSFLNRLPFAKTKHQLFLPLFPMAIESFDFSEYDLVISTSHCVARGAITRSHTFHFSYLHTPVRYAWDFSKVYQASLKPRFLVDLVWPIFMHYLRVWDVAAVNRVDQYTCNAKNVARRIKKIYDRESEVIYPPVDTERFQIGDKREDYFFILAALVPYKRVDLAVKACVELGVPLKLAGIGPEESNLRELAGSGNVEFLGRVGHEEAVELYQKAAGFLFPGEEDFGITPLEAQACGTPVIAYARGGALETVVDQKTGIYFNEQTVESMKAAITKCQNMEFDRSVLRNHALTFDNACFRERFAESVCRSYHNYLSLMDNAGL